MERQTDIGLPQIQIEGQVSEEQSAVDPLLLNVSDDELITEIEERLRGCEKETTDLRAKQKKGNKYYEGDQLADFERPDWQLEAVNNRIYVSIETLIPLITANAGDPSIQALKTLPGQEDMAGDYVEMLSSMCLYDYDVTLNLKDKVRMVVRDWFTSLVGVGKFRYDAATGDVVFEKVDPRNIFLPGPGQPTGWVIEYIQTTIADLLIQFPKAEKKLREKFWTSKEKIPSNILGTEVGYYAYWTDSFCVFKLDDIILDKKRNPHWDWDGQEVQVGNEPTELENGEIVMQPIVETYKYRLLDRPRHPYFFFNYNKKGNLDYDRTGPLFQAIPSQDLINDRKRQIHKTTSDTGIMVASGDAISEQEWRKYDGSPLSTFWAKAGVDINRAFTRLPGATVDPSALMDLQDSRQEIDNIFGTQNVTRGVPNSQSESGVARQVLREADLSRVGPIAEAVENYLQQVYMYLIQMRMIFTDTEYDFPSATPTDSGDYQNKVFDRNSIPMCKVTERVVIGGKVQEESYMKPIPITLRVRRNSTLPKDQLSEFNRALQLLQAGLVDPLTAYEMMGESNPTGKLTRLLKFQTNPISLLPQDKQMELMGMMMPQTDMGAEGAGADEGMEAQAPQEPPIDSVI